MMYQVVNQMIRYEDTNGQVWWIPINDANTDYERYLAWLAEGNEPEVIV